MTLQGFENLQGRQTPLISSMFEGVESKGPSAIELARRTRTVLMPWQEGFVEPMLRLDSSGLWVHGDCGLTVPRQNGKGVVLSTRCLYGLFVLNERIFYSAQEFKTASDAYKRLLAMIKSRPSLARRVVKSTLSQGVGHIMLESGAEIMFIARSNNSGRGFDRIDLLILDEAYNLTDGEVSALGPTQQASDNPQTIYTSSAVNQDQHPNGLVLTGVRDRGIAKDDGLLYAEFAAEDGLPRDDPETWKSANPSFGVIMNEAKVRKLIKMLSTVAGRKGFDVEILGRGDWPVEVSVDVEVIIDPNVWGAMASKDSKLGKRVSLAVDMSPDRKWISIAAAARTADGRIHVEVGYHAAPSGDLVKRLLALIEKWDPCALVMDRQSPAYSMFVDLVNAGIEPEVTSAAQIVQATGGFYDDAVAGLLAHTGDPLLAAAIEGASKRTLTGGGWAWDRKGNMTISPLVAATLAHWGLKTFEVQKPPPAAPAAEEYTHSSDDLDVLSAAF